MQHFGTFKTSGGKSPAQSYEIVWLTTKEDWNFVESWKAEVSLLASQPLRDSFEYAQLGAKRWSSLAAEGSCVTGFGDVDLRITGNPADEFGFALAVLTSGRDGSRTISAFCYGRRIWLNHLYLEFLAAVQEGVGSLLLYCLAEIAGKIGAGEIWGECTAGSQGFYRRIKAKLIRAHLTESLEAGNSYLVDVQMPGAVHDRFIFGKGELQIMAGILSTWRAD